MQIRRLYDRKAKFLSSLSKRAFQLGMGRFEEGRKSKKGPELSHALLESTTSFDKELAHRYVLKS